MSGGRLICDPPELDWSQPSGPRASDYGDVYFSAEDGLEETRAVFLAGCDLPAAWAGRSLYTVGELGFGTGLNALALWQMWREHRPAGGWLHFVSVEKHPLSRDEAGRAFAAWPGLKALSDQLLAQWPPRLKGPHRMVFAQDRFTITVFHDEAEAALAQMDAIMDAWFLDGFAPARNEAMWSQDVLDHVGRLSGPGARIGTFTVAGAVRRGLQAAGFAVSKQPGFGRKRERLEAVYQGTSEREAAADLRPIAILGAGIAGASLAYAAGRRGREVMIIDPAGIAGGASSAPAGMLTPRLEKADRPHVRATLGAFAYARRLYQDLPGFYPTGAVRKLNHEKDEARYGAIADLMDTDIHIDGDRLCMDEAGWFVPATLVRALIADVPVLPIRPQGEFCVIDARGYQAAHADISPSAGQVAVFDAEPPVQPITWGHYACPTPDGQLLLGATHIKGDQPGSAKEAEQAFRQDALDVLPELAAGLATDSVSGWSGVRASTPDRLPVAGRWSSEATDWVLSGLGSRGFAHAPLLAEHILSQICGEPSPLERAGADALAPDRFELRRQRRGG
ncbi:tRNA (5-methylaminomethyl-2-thiouridine)(34)-methyltransferase MnmD [Maricaulis sp.]|uniref:tRNA (5-methylaminomethyl-2-thiouridine)(34)-methyltransferase MnmD n=1 Tax=Maricaulis sp. TaxID=1486257 RepID=UPI0026343163|nr:tRNA (5-methylaminomethyl-2-thiouridine)(34)-methyltransferase MnmD [Maricaulis sp.]